MTTTHECVHPMDLLPAVIIDKTYVQMNRILLLLLLLPLTMLSCRHGQPSDREIVQTDSVLRAHTDLLFSNPKKGERVLAQYQRSLTDSMAWYKVEVFRATAYNLAGDTLASHRRYERVLRWCSHTPGAHAVAGQVWNHRGVNAMLRGDTQQSYACYERAFTLLNQPPKTTELISSAINLADMNMLTGRLPRASELYRYALFLCDSLRDQRSRVPICVGLGQVYMELENFPESHRYFHQASLRLKGETLQTQFLYHLSLGNCYYYEKRYEEALRSFRTACSFAQKLNNEAFRINCDANMGEVYLMMDDLPRARACLNLCEKALNNRSLVNTDNAFYIRSLLADLSIAEGHPSQSNNDFSLGADSLLVSTPRYLMLHYRRLQHYAARDHRWHDAYRYQSLSALYADSLNSCQARNTMAEMAGRYQRDTTLLRQHLAIADYAARNVRQQSYIILTVSLVALLALAATLIIVLYRRRTQERMKRQMERMTELRMDVVRNRVSPHYVFNVLGTVLPKLQRYPELVAPVEMLIDVLRGNLLTSGKVAVSLCDELTLVRRFVDLHHYSKGPLPQVTWKVAPELENSQLRVPSMSLQIPVENALKHAFPVLTEDCAIHIEVTLTTEGLLHIQVTDNGQGYNPGRVKRTGRDTGTGLLLLTRTLEILNQYNRRQARFSISNVSLPHHGTRMELLMPTDYCFETSKR